LILLKNGKDQKAPFLPLAKTAKRILVAGTHADDIAWHGDSGKITLGKMELCFSQTNICIYKFFPYFIHSLFFIIKQLFDLDDTVIWYSKIGKRLHSVVTCPKLNQHWYPLSQMTIVSSE
jgi:hypothetical protein